MIRHPACTTLHLQLFNRWGQLVYGSEDYPNDWDGKSNRGAAFGANFSDGTYHYGVQLGTVWLNRPTSAIMGTVFYVTRTCASYKFLTDGL